MNKWTDIVLDCRSGYGDYIWFYNNKIKCRRISEPKCKKHDADFTLHLYDNGKISWKGPKICLCRRFIEKYILRLLLIESWGSDEPTCGCEGDYCTNPNCDWPEEK